MNIGIIGAGEMGRCLATKFVQLGHAVSIANSRGTASLKQVAEETGAEAVSAEDAVNNKEVVIVSIPSKNVPALINLFAGLPANTIVIDTGNYYPNLRDGTIPALGESGIDSLWVQEQLGVPVVKVFNSILATSIRDKGKPKGDKDRIAMAVSGDDAKAKEIVFELVDTLGFDPFDIGTIAGSWKQQPGSPVYCRDISLAELQKRIAVLGTDPGMHTTILAKRKADEALMKADYAAYLEGLKH